MLARADVGNAAFAQLAGDITEGFSQILITHVMQVGPWRQMHTDPASAPDFNRGIGHFEQQARAVFDAATVLVGTFVGAALQELVEQVTICAMYLDAVKTGGLGVLGARAVGLDNIGDLGSLQCAWYREINLGAYQADMALGGDGARGNRRFAIQVHRVRYAAYMPQLQCNPATGRVYGLGDVGPAAYLIVSPDARGVRVADAHWRDRRGLAQDQAS